MAARSIKLKEAHKSSSIGSVSTCSILWDLKSEHLVTSSTSDTNISIHDALLTSKSPKILPEHKQGVTALALNPDSTCLASGSLDHSVKLYDFPGGKFQTNVTRFTLPIRCLSFNKSGSLLAAAGDDEAIKLINTIDGTIAKVLKAHKGPVTGLAFDPVSDYLASVDSIGTVIIWEVSSGKPMHTLKSVAPDNKTDTSVLNVLSWSPAGDVLAVPGLKNDVVMYDRDTSEEEGSLGGHSKSVCFISWSPNGKYMATSSLDKQIWVWDVDKKQDINCQKFEDRISSMAWKPTGNALAVIDINGKYGVWDSVVPSHMKSPLDGAPKPRSNASAYFDEDTHESSGSGSLSNCDESSFGEPEPLNRKRLRKQTEFDTLVEDGDGAAGFSTKAKPRKKASDGHKKPVDDVYDEVGSGVKLGRPKMQESFQPGCTPLQSGKRRFLCYNMLGIITSMETDGYSHIEVDFHDTGKGPRVPSMTDYFGFTMASLNENGSVFANPCKGENNMSTLMYRPFSSWANNSEWLMRFEGEEVKVVALGSGWVAAITSLNYLRIFSEGGLQKHVLSLDGPVVTASGFKDELAVVTHASRLPSNDQMLEFRVFNFAKETQPIKGCLPLTPGSCLTWLGYSEEGQLSSYDSKGVLRVFTNQFGGSWLPLFSACKDKPEDNYWVVGLNESTLFCILCKNPLTYPLVTPKPVLTLLNLLFPLASSDLGANVFENKLMLKSLSLSQTQKRIEEMATAHQSTMSLEDKAFDIETSLDQCILKLIDACCNGDKLERATELVKLLSLDKSVKGAIKLATLRKLPVLADRFNCILEERMQNETTETTPYTKPSSNGFKAQEIMPIAANRRMEVEDALPQPKLHSPLFSRQEKTEISRSAVGKERIESNGHLSAEKIKITDRKVQGEANSLKKVMTIPEKPALFGSISKIIGKGNISEDISQSELHRPTNPFAKKSPNTQVKTPSLLDSIKKMKDGGKS
ncbi:hypothetical protein MKW94_022549 [Papaver nudicaule]|uniref:Minichromosome loss protein Mcl1 middle region domain-containing protein n=1 Tax=Papaver nudicaule TaxID=74823 RepID=A0AA41SHI4_PAPNU|nr:hypothetical protein [Papaver nudicaule]